MPESRRSITGLNLADVYDISSRQLERTCKRSSDPPWAHVVISHGTSQGLHAASRKARQPEIPSVRPRVFPSLLPPASNSFL